MQPAKPRFDGWTPARQLAFLETLARARRVSAADRSVGMSREGAYRLRRRADAGLFAAAWDRAMGAGPLPGPAPKLTKFTGERSQKPRYGGTALRRDPAARSTCDLSEARRWR
jgi:hypothetical protein